MKLLGVTVGAAMFYTAVAPNSQAPKLAQIGGNFWVSVLKTLTGQK